MHPSYSFILTYNNNKSENQPLILPFFLSFSSHACTNCTQESTRVRAFVVSSIKREWAPVVTLRSRKLKGRENPGRKCKLIEFRFKRAEYMHVFTVERFLRVRWNRCEHDIYPDVSPPPPPLPPSRESI